MTSPGKHEIGVGALVLLALGLLAFMAVKMGSLRGLGEEVAVDVVLPDAAGIGVGATVRVAGVEVGRVEGLQVDFDRARIALRLRRDAALRRDVVAQVRARSVLGEKFISLSPVSAEAPLLEDGDTIAAVRPQTEIDELVNAMGPALQGLDPAALQRLLDQLDRALGEDPERLPRMAADLEALLRNARLASEEAPALATEARAALAELRATNRRAGALLDRGDASLARIDALTAGLPATQAELDALLAETRGAVQEGREVLGRVDGQMGQVEQVLANLSEIDKWELRRLLREEGIKVRLRPAEVQVPPGQ